MNIRELSLIINDYLNTHGQFPGFLLGDFLDDFRRRPDVGLLQEEVYHIEHPDHSHMDAYLAAMAEYVCMEMGVDPPDWVSKKEYFLKRPWFAGGLENLKAILLVESPGPFRRRNLFVSNNAMSRV